MQGNIAEMAVADLIQHTCQDRKTARVTFSNGAHEAMLFFKDGEIIHASLGKTEGEEVVYLLLNWKEGTFTLENGKKAPKTTITRRWTGLLLLGAQRLDESEHLISNQEKEYNMSNISESLKEIMTIDGALACALVNVKSGMTLGTAGTGINIELAAAGNTNVVRAKMAVMKDLKIKGTIEDILITLTDQIHLIRLSETDHDIFIYVALDRAKANLGLARHKLSGIEKDLEM